MDLHSIIAQAEVAGNFWQRTYYNNTVSTLSYLPRVIFCQYQAKT